MLVLELAEKRPGAMASLRLCRESPVDKPFRGALIPNAVYGKDTRVQSVMVELRRDLYMDETTGKKLEGPFQQLQAVLTELRGKLEDFAARGDSTQSSASKQ